MYFNVSRRFPRGFVYRTARQDKGPIKRMEVYLDYATRNAFDFFENGAKQCLDVTVLHFEQND